MSDIFEKYPLPWGAFALNVTDNNGKVIVSAMEFNLSQAIVDRVHAAVAVQRMMSEFMDRAIEEPEMYGECSSIDGTFCMFLLTATALGNGGLNTWHIIVDERSKLIEEMFPNCGDLSFAQFIDKEFKETPKSFTPFLGTLRERVIKRVANERLQNTRRETQSLS